MKLRIPYWYFLLGPTLLFYIGGFLNVFVMALNHGQMPVQIPHDLQQAVEFDGRHCLMVAQTHLKFLCDWINLNDLGVASPGDMLVWFGDKFNDTSLAIWAALTIKDSQK